MEAILVTVSGLSTLVVVAIVLSVVVILCKLKGKVGVEVINDVIRQCDDNKTDLEMEISGINEDINRRIDKIEDSFYRDMGDRFRKVDSSIIDVDKKIDSRNDKLYDHMREELENLHREVDKTQKVLLKD